MLFSTVDRSILYVNGTTYFSIRMAAIRISPVSSPEVAPCHTPMDTERVMRAIKDSVMYATWNFLVSLVPPTLRPESSLTAMNMSATPEMCTI